MLAVTHLLVSLLIRVIRVRNECVFASWINETSQPLISTIRHRFTCQRPVQFSMDDSTRPLFTLLTTSRIAYWSVIGCHHGSSWVIEANLAEGLPLRLRNHVIF